MHSPWGVLFEIIKETGWTRHYVLWKVSRANLMLMMADRSRLKYGQKGDAEEAELSTGSSLAKKFNAKRKGKK